MMRYKNEKLQRSSHTEVSVARCAVCRLARRNWFRGHGLVELADARAFWIESDRLPASRRTAHLEQGSVRWIAWTARAKRPPASWLERTLEAADAGGAGKIPSRPSCLLEPNDIAPSKAERLAQPGWLGSHKPHGKRRIKEWRYAIANFISSHSRGHFGNAVRICRSVSPERFASAWH